MGKILLTIQIRDLHLPALPAEQASLFLCSCAFIVSGQFTYISFTVSSDEKRMRVWSIPDGIHWKHSPPADLDEACQISTFESVKPFLPSFTSTGFSVRVCHTNILVQLAALGSKSLRVTSSFNKLLS